MVDKINTVSEIALVLKWTLKTLQHRILEVTLAGV